MRLIRHGSIGDEKPGLVDAQGGLRDLSAFVRDIAGPALSPDSLDRLRLSDPETLPRLAPDTRLGPCVGGTRNVVAIGLNYVAHAQETGSSIPAEPIIFNKAPSSLCGPNDTVIIPKGASCTDWEVELAVVIGRPASYVHANEALDYVAGACICNDLGTRIPDGARRHLDQGQGLPALRRRGGHQGPALPSGLSGGRCVEDQSHSRAPLFHS